MHPVVALHDENGVIQITQMDNGIHGEDGTIDEVSGLIVHRVYSLDGMRDMGEFMERYIWCNSLDWWKQVPPKPNAFAFWDATLEPAGWNWDRSIFLDEVRRQRNMKLGATDWMVLPDSPVDYATRESVLEYRQLLRDFPSTLTGDETSLEELQWPSNPTDAS